MQSSNLFNIERSFKQMGERSWPNLYWCIDLHDTIIEGKYNLFNEGAKMYPGAYEVLYFLTSSPLHKLILWTSSHKVAIAKVREQFKAHYGIIFDYVNENPDCTETDLCDFSTKFYFNILLDDKAGFNGSTDWFKIRDELIRLNRWER